MRTYNAFMAPTTLRPFQQYLGYVTSTITIQSNGVIFLRDYASKVTSKAGGRAVAARLLLPCTDMARFVSTLLVPTTRAGGGAEKLTETFRPFFLNARYY